MAGDPEPDKLVRILPRILKFAINAEKDTLAGRINFVSLFLIFILTAALNAGPKLIDQVAQALITLKHGEKELPKPPDFDYGLLWMWLLFMVVCMIFTSLSEKKIHISLPPARKRGVGEEPDSGASDTPTTS